MRAGRHAVSIDERRCFYRDNLWGAPIEPTEPNFLVQQDIKRVWFAGVHSDVAGSYAEAESGLSKITLEWMMHEAANFGLLIDTHKAKVVLGRAPKTIEWMPDYVQPTGAIRLPAWCPQVRALGLGANLGRGRREAVTSDELFFNRYSAHKGGAPIWNYCFSENQAPSIALLAP